MAASQIWLTPRALTWRWRWTFFILLPVLSVTVTSWWLTEPLEDHGAFGQAAFAGEVADSGGPTAAARRCDEPPLWPGDRVEGPVAKRVLLETLQAVAERLKRVDGYSAMLRKQERLNGVLGAEQTLAMKVRHRPFAIYLKFLSGPTGKEVVYAQGHHDNKVIAHTPGIAGWLVPRLAVPPDHPIALAETRHAVTEAGIANLTQKLLRFRIMDMDDSEAVTVLDRVVDANGRSWLYSLHTHPNRDADRPFARTEVLYDPETRFPVQIKNYDWPGPGHESELLLAEQYTYENLNVDAGFSDLDFDPANPAYAFHRY